MFESVTSEVVSPQRKPALLRGVDLGPCLEKWTAEYLRQKGSDKEVKIHVSTVPQMDFLRKNFVYKWAVTQTQTPNNAQTSSQLHWFIHRTLPFSEFVKRASERKHSDFFLCEVTSTKECFLFNTTVVTVCRNIRRCLIAGWELLPSLTGRGRTQGEKHNAAIFPQKLVMDFDFLTGTCWSSQTVSWPGRGLSHSRVLYSRSVFFQCVPHQFLWPAVVDTLRCERFTFVFSDVLVQH